MWVFFFVEVGFEKWKIFLCLKELYNFRSPIQLFSAWYRAEAIKKANGLLFSEEVFIYFVFCYYFLYPFAAKVDFDFTFLAQYSTIMCLSSLSFSESLHLIIKDTFIRSSVSGLFNFWWHLTTCTWIIFFIVMSRLVVFLSPSIYSDANLFWYSSMIPPVFKYILDKRSRHTSW